MQLLGKGSGGFLFYVVIAMMVISEMRVDVEGFFGHGKRTRTSMERRGFKSSLLSTARGFGKRSPVQEQFHQLLGLGVGEFADLVAENPTLARALAEKLDLDQDGHISPYELVKLPIPVNFNSAEEMGEEMPQLNHRFKTI